MGIAGEMCYHTSVSERRRKRERARPDKTEDRMGGGGEEDITPGYITFHVQGEAGEEGGSRKTLVHSN